MSSSSPRYVNIGLRGSGKSTFLGALWHVVESGELATALRVQRLQRDREYLNALRDKWLELEEVGRTHGGGIPEVVSMLLEDPATGASAEVTFPDLSGESFRHQWEERKASAAYIEYVRGADGLILFLHPHRVRAGSRLDAIASALQGDDQGAGIEENAEGTSSDASDDRAEPKRGADEGAAGTGSVGLPWVAAHAPTQVQLVELLQFVMSLRSERSLMPTAVIVSAWDLLRPPLQPSEWLERRLPLLAQFLAANTSADGGRYRVYGVSAQGGDLQADRAALVKVRPSERVRVVDSGRVHHDLSVPLKWLLTGR